MLNLTGEVAFTCMGKKKASLALFLPKEVSLPFSMIQNINSSLNEQNSDVAFASISSLAASTDRPRVNPPAFIFETQGSIPFGEPPLNRKLML